MSDSELFEMDTDIPAFVQRSVRYIKRKNDFVNSYIDKQEFQNSQDILESFSQNPKIVKTSKILKRKLDHLTYEERANKLALQSVSNTIAQLRQTPGSAAKDQVKVLVSSVTHHRWGTPNTLGKSVMETKESSQRDESEPFDRSRSTVDATTKEEEKSDT